MQLRAYTTNFHHFLLKNWIFGRRPKRIQVLFREIALRPLGLKNGCCRLMRIKELIKSAIVLQSSVSIFDNFVYPTDENPCVFSGENHYVYFSNNVRLIWSRDLFVNASRKWEEAPAKKNPLKTTSEGRSCVLRLRIFKLTGTGLEESLLNLKCGQL